MGLFDFLHKRGPDRKATLRRPAISSFELDRKLVYGLNKTGKSTWTKDFLEDKPYIVFDPNADTIFEVNESKLQLVYNPTNEFDEDELRDFMAFVKKNKVFRRRDMWIVFDEAHNIWPNKGGLQKLPDDLKLFITRGRHAPWFFSMLFIGLKPSMLNPVVQDLALSMIVFRIDGNQSVKALNEKRDGLGDVAKELDDFHYLSIEQGEKGFKENMPVKL